METRSPRSGSGCLSHEGLDAVSLPVSSDSTLAKSSQGDREKEDEVPADSSVLDPERLVPASPENEAGSHPSSSSTGLPSSRGLPTSGSSVGSSLRLHIGWKPAQPGQDGLTDAARNLVNMAIRTSSRKQYDSKFMVFAQWCLEHNLDCYTCTPQEVAIFLAYVATERTFRGKFTSSHSCAAGYRTSISHYHLGWGGISVGDHPLISNTIKGVFHTNPPSKKYPQVWSKDKLLEAWRENDFPLHSWSIKDLRSGLLVRLVMAGCLRFIFCFSDWKQYFHNVLFSE